MAELSRAASSRDSEAVFRGIVADVQFTGFKFTVVDEDLYSGQCLKSCFYSVPSYVTAEGESAPPNAALQHGGSNLSPTCIREICDREVIFNIVFITLTSRGAGPRQDVKEDLCCEFACLNSDAPRTQDARSGN